MSDYAEIYNYTRLDEENSDIDVPLRELTYYLDYLDTQKYDKVTLDKIKNDLRLEYYK